MSNETPFYVIGDIQGCKASLDQLLERLPDDAEIIFAGDLVNRGPDSLGSLKTVMALGDRATSVLGNHDLHLLAVAAGVGKAHKKDTISDILEAPDADVMIDWLRNRPLMIERGGIVITHAGIHPKWTLEEARQHAHEAETLLRGKKWKKKLAKMYGGLDWDERLEGEERVQAILNCFTRMRFVHERTGELNFDFKEGLDSVPPEWIPWFKFSPRPMSQTPICFGHWSMLGLINTENLIATDTGCLWGGSLTAVRFPDRDVISVGCPCWADPMAFKKKTSR